MTRAAPLTAGELDQRIAIEVKAPGRDAVGQRVETWAPLIAGTYWARARPTTGREYVRADAVQSTANVVFAMRWQAGIVGDTRVLRVIWNGKPYQVIAPPTDVDGGRHTIELTCEGGRPA